MNHAITFLSRDQFATRIAHSHSEFRVIFFACLLEIDQSIFSHTKRRRSIEQTNDSDEHTHWLKLNNKMKKRKQGFSPANKLPKSDLRYRFTEATELSRVFLISIEIPLFASSHTKGSSIHDFYLRFISLFVEITIFFTPSVCIISCLFSFLSNIKPQTRYFVLLIINKSRKSTIGIVVRFFPFNKITIKKWILSSLVSSLHFL